LHADFGHGYNSKTGVSESVAHGAMYNQPNQDLHLKASPFISLKRFRVAVQRSLRSIWYM
jgi:hypothetical protein